MHYFMGIDHERCSLAPSKQRSGPRRGLGRSENEAVPGFCRKESEDYAEGLLDLHSLDGFCSLGIVIS